MDRKDAQAPAGDRAETARQSFDYLRQRSLHRIWWSSARVAMRRGRSGEPSLISQTAIVPPGKRV